MSSKQRSANLKMASVALGVLVGAAVLVAAGTVLTLTIGEVATQCSHGSDGSAAVNYTINSNAASAATVDYILTANGGGLIDSGNDQIAAGNVVDGGGWTFVKSTKTFAGKYTKTGLTPGTYTFNVCVTQTGANGNPAKGPICQNTTFTVASCVEQINNPCVGAESGPFGEVLGNTDLRTSSTVQIQFRGDFGAAASVNITGPSPDNTFDQTHSIARDGDSCNYHANWKFTNDSGGDFFGNAGAGVYTVTVSGNGNTNSFALTLNDSSK